jgi:hypothetical protein
VLPHPNRVVEVLDADRTEPAFTKGRDWLTAHPTADHVVALCLNEDACLGFHSAVEQANRAGQVIFASNGGDPSAHDLIRTDEEQFEEGVPGLSDLPLLGRLFGRNRTRRQGADGVLTLTPHIVRLPNITEEDVRPIWVAPEPNVAFRGGRPRT